MNEHIWDTYFGLAAAGYIASFAGYDTGETTMAPPEDVADYAAKCADAMMAERSKRIEAREAEDAKRRQEEEARFEAELDSLFDPHRGGVT